MNMKSSTSTSTKEKKKKMMMRGFMCQSPATTAVCASIADARSVTVPGRPAPSHLHHGHGQYMRKRRSTTSTSLNYVDHSHTRSLLNNKYNIANACGHYYYSRLLSTSTPLHDHDKLHTINPPAAAHNKKPSLLILPRPSSINKQGTDHHDHDLTLKHQQQISKSSIQKFQTSSDSVLPSSADNNVFQVVVMRVSLHCQGCAGKVKKHLSKMEGVTSFSIDLETKMVTVRGHVSPDGVVESISKVKKAELWPC